MQFVTVKLPRLRLPILSCPTQNAYLLRWTQYSMSPARPSRRLTTHTPGLLQHIRRCDCCMAPFGLLR
ncbi:hypothetical protein E2C01_097124 [Portunus trituberculatus]|uniref:Uncharacterized protein n=1 Tax=Portunus trituberculatus TaxID=210409 RepID=A0A5B7K3N9_PORTR|nr:hypothetical protein [Portunus trituberculatus]